MRRSREEDARLESIENVLVALGRMRAELELAACANAIERQRLGRTVMNETIEAELQGCIARCARLQDAVCRLTRYEYAYTGLAERGQPA